MLIFYRLARSLTGAPAPPIRPYRMSRGPRFGQMAKRMKSKNPTEPRGIILFFIVTSTKDGIGIRRLFWNTLHEKGYHVQSSMAFRGNDMANGLWHHIVCQNEALFGTWAGPGMGSKAPGADFQCDQRVTRFSFSSCRNGFFCEATTGAHLSIERNHHAVIGDHLRTTYHIPYARVSYLAILAASCGVPPNPLETDRI